MRRRQLHLVITINGNGRLTRPELLADAAAAVAASVDIVQVRAKAGTPEALAKLVQAVRAAVAGRALVLMNGSVEAALAAGAEGVHLPEAHPDLGRARRLLGPGVHIGASVHSVAAARMAERAGVTSVTFGHIYPTASHPNEPARGLAALKEVVAAVDIPVIAIGGIDVRRVPDILTAGAAGVAVISAIMGAADPAAAAASLRAALDTIML